MRYYRGIMSLIHKSQEEILKGNKERGYKLYKDGYTSDIQGDIIKINNKYEIRLSKDNSWLCNCDDFVYRSGHYSSYYCKHIYAYLFSIGTGASKDIVTILSM